MGKVDDLDFAILRQVTHPQTFQWNARLSYADISRAMDADEETVRLRVLRMQEHRIILRWDVVVHPGVFGRDYVRYDLPPTPSESREKLLAALRSLDGAQMLFEYYGGRFALVAFQEPGPPAQRQVALLGALADGPPRVTVFTMPKVSIELRPLDWRIVQALRRDARAPQAALAAAVGVSERTLRRRLDRLTEGRALFLNPEIDLSRIQGALPCIVRIVHGPSSPRRALDDALRALPRIVFSWFEGDESRVSYNAGTLASVEQTRRDLEALAGKHATVSLELTLRRIGLPAWLDDQIARRATG